MRKSIIFSIIALTIIACITVIVLTNNKNGKIGGHQHTYSSEWSFDEASHWHVATCEHDDQVSSLSAHKWNAGVVTTVATEDAEGVITYTCVICKATKTEKIEKTTHVCSFTEQIVDDKYIASQADCLNPATYYYSCKCGEKGTETFTSGTELGHTFSDTWTYDENYHWHVATCEHTSEVKGKAEHTFDGDICSTCKYEKQPVYSQGLEYTLINNDTEYEVSGIGTCADTEIIIPSIYNGKPVTSIGGYAFNDCSSLTNVKIPNGVTSIGSYAFYGCSGFTSVNIPNGVTSIGEFAFNGCSSLVSVTIGNNITSIGYNAFYGCDKLQYNIYDNALYLGNNDNKYIALIKATDNKITSCNINSDCKVICYKAFEYCSNLTSVNIPNGVTSIGMYAFNYCSSLNSITIGSSVTLIDLCAFYYCSDLENITFNGTTEQWIAIKKSIYWQTAVPATVVHCSNGDVGKNE